MNGDWCGCAIVNSVAAAAWWRMVAQSAPILNLPPCLLSQAVSQHVDMPFIFALGGLLGRRGHPIGWQGRSMAHRALPASVL